MHLLKTKTSKEVFVFVIASLGPLTAGLAFGYSSAAVMQLQLPVVFSSLFSSLLNVGGLVGSLAAAPLLLKVGRRGSFITACPFGILGWFVIYGSARIPLLAAYPITPLLIGRFLTGFSAAMVLISCSTYLIEIAPPGYRGLVGTLPQVGIVIGIALAYVLGLQVTWFNVARTHTIFMLLLNLFAFFLPESPRWLKSRERHAEAVNALSWLRNEPSERELSEMCDRTNDAEPAQHISLIQVLLPCSAIPYGLRSRLYVALILMTLQQLSGINAIMFFAETICSSVSTHTAGICSLSIGVFQALFTMVAAFLMDSLPRKKMLQVTAIVMGLAHLLFAFCHATGRCPSLLPIGCLLLYMCGFSFGWGPLPLLVTIELFPVLHRGSAVGSAIACNWIVSFFVTQAFAPFSLWFGQVTVFAVFALFCFLSARFVQAYVPETNNRFVVEPVESSPKHSPVVLSGI